MLFSVAVGTPLVHFRNYSKQCLLYFVKKKKKQIFENYTQTNHVSALVKGLTHYS